MSLKKLCAVILTCLVMQKLGMKQKPFPIGTKMKAKEKQGKSAETSILGNVPRALPSLTRAAKLQNVVLKQGLIGKKFHPYLTKCGKN